MKIEEEVLGKKVTGWFVVKNDEGEYLQVNDTGPPEWNRVDQLYSTFQTREIANAIIEKIRDKAAAAVKENQNG